MRQKTLQANQRRLLQELAKRNVKVKPSFNTPGFEIQNEFINDFTSPFLVAQCTRRAGKSYGAGLKLFKAAYDNPGCTVVYLAKTRQSAKNIMCKDVLSKINRKYEIGATFNKSDLTWSLPNGSQILMQGLDNSEDEADKLLGQKFKLIVIDEAAFILRDLRKVIMEILKPACADEGGQIVMISTTSDLLNTYYYKVTVGEIGGWKVMRWTCEDNPFMQDKMRKEIRALKTANPRVTETPAFRRMYLNQWVIDIDSIIYKYEKSNIVERLPDTPLDYIIGIDLGWNDATAFSVCGYNEDKLYVAETYKKSKMLLTDVAEKIKELEVKYGGFQRIIIDGASKQAVEEMRARYGIPFTSAEKQGKKDHIEMMNTEMAVRRVMFLEGSTQPLLEEYDNLVWDDRKAAKGKWVEHPACDNHLADATLYAYWYAHCYFFNDNMLPEEVEHVEPTSERAVEIWEQREMMALERRKHVEHDYLEDGFESGESDWLE